MALVVPNVAEVVMLQRLLGVAANGNQVLRLYKSDVTPVEGTTIGSSAGQITQTTADGYTAITLSTGSWAVATALGTTTGTYAEQTFTFTTSETLYGYYVTDLSGNLLWVERFTGAPFILPISGGQIAITPTVNLE
jgi:hypothetical protein